MFTKINATQETKGLLDTFQYQGCNRLIINYLPTPGVQKKRDTVKVHFTFLETFIKLCLQLNKNKEKG